MNDNFDEKTINQLLGALEGMKEMSRKAQERRDMKVWNEIDVPISLHVGLSMLTKSDLDSIRKQLDIKSASSLKKSELIGVLEEKIPKLLEKVCLRLDHQRYKIMRKIVSQGGFALAPNLKTNQIEYFRSMGFVFTGTYKNKRILTIPKDIITKLEFLENNANFHSIIARNTEWIKLTHGLLYYYGTLSDMDLIKLVEKYSNVEVELSEYFQVLYHANLYYQEFYTDKDSFSNARVFDPEKVMKEQNMRRNVDYYPFSKEQLLKAGEAEYVDRTDSYLKLVSFITGNYDISREEADSIAEECVYATRIGKGPNDIMQYLERRLEFDSLETVQGFMDRVVELINNTRQWFLKGYSPYGLRDHRNKDEKSLSSAKNNVFDMKTKKKIGRNDPCPCGSGEKYKKCCGK